MWLLRSLYRKWTKKEWTIAFCRNTYDGLIQGETLSLSLMKLQEQGHWFADPFIYQVTPDDVILFVEDFDKKKEYGCISVLIVDRKSLELKSRRVILDIGKHVSFPFIYRKDGKVYFCPEQSTGGSLNLYEYKDGSCKRVRTILNKAVADAVIQEEDGVYRLYCTQEPSINGNQLVVYVMDELGMNVRLEKIISFEDYTARMAGDFFMCNNKRYRPAQVAGTYYGEGLSIQQVENGEMWEVRRLYSNVKGWDIGPHTMNSSDGVMVMDVCRFVHPIIGKFLYRFVHLFYHQV